MHVHAVRSDCTDADLSCTLLLGISSCLYGLQNHFSVSVLDTCISQVCAWVLTLVPLLYHIHPSATGALGKSVYSQSPGAERETGEWPCRRTQLGWSLFLSTHRVRQFCQKLIQDVLSKRKKGCFVAHWAVPRLVKAEKKNIMKAEPIPSLKGFNSHV